MSNVQYPYGLERTGMSYADKDDRYRKMMLDHYCSILNHFNIDRTRMRENYLLKNSQLKKDDYRYLCGTFGSNEITDMFVDMFNFTPNIIESLKGEELARPFPFTVVANSERINNRTERAKMNSINTIIETIFQLEANKAEAIKKLELSKIPKEQLEKEGEKIEKEFKRRFHSLPNVKEIFHKYQSMQSLEEITMNKVMKILYDKDRIKQIKNDTFEDILVAGCAFVEIHWENNGTLPSIRPINPLTAFWQSAPNLRYVHQGSYAGYKEPMTLDMVIEEYGNYLDDKDFEKLITQGTNWGVLGMDQHFYSKGDIDPWRSGRFGEGGIGYGGSASTHQDWQNVGMESYGGENFGWIPNAQQYNIGLHTTMQFRSMNTYIDKYVVYWKSKRKLGKLRYVNEYGEIDYTFVDEDFVIPKSAKREITKPDNLTKDLVEYVWLDGRNNKMSLEWLWINEVWKGVRLGNKHVIVEPLVASYKSLLNPFEVKLPIYGLVVNNRNALPMSKMDAMKPWQKLYFAVMAKLQKMLHQDKGTWTFIDTMYMDKDIGVMDTMALAEDQGYVLYNRMSVAKDGLQNLMQSTQMATQVNMTNSQSVTYYKDFLSYIEENITKAAGMSPQRIAQTQTNSTATDNYRETQSSMNITEPLFYAHDMLWENIMTGFMEMVLITLSDNSGVLREVLSDEEKVVIDLDYVSLVDNYNLRVGNSGKQGRILEMMMQYAQALIQNDKVTLGQLIKLSKTDDLTEFQVYIDEIEAINAKREEELQKQQQQHEMQMAEEEAKNREDIQIHQLNAIALKARADYERDLMKSRYTAASFSEDKDTNKDGVADAIQLEQLQQKVDNESFKVATDRQRLEVEKQVKEKELETKRISLELERAAKGLQNEQHDKKLKNDRVIAMQKAAIQAKRSAKK